MWRVGDRSACRLTRSMPATSSCSRRSPRTTCALDDYDKLQHGGVALDTKLWDVAAGALIAREAGVVLGGEGGDFSTRLTIGAAPPLWPALSATIRAALTR
jgi:myo-inositol-1(or 4)-monophosphatase